MSEVGLGSHEQKKKDAPGHSKADTTESISGRGDANESGSSQYPGETGGHSVGTGAHPSQDSITGSSSSGSGSGMGSTSTNVNKNKHIAGTGTDQTSQELDKKHKNTETNIKSTDKEKSSDKEKSVTHKDVSQTHEKSKHEMSDKGKKKHISVDRLLGRARFNLEHFMNPKLNVDRQIPAKLLKNSYGSLFLTEFKGGMGVGASSGAGFIIVHKPDDDKFSQPCAVAMGGVSIGFQAGTQKIEHVFIFRDEKVLRSFIEKGELNFSGDISLSAGPLGRDVDVPLNTGDKGYSSIYSYSISNGAYVGVTLESQKLEIRDDWNEEYFGKKVDAKDILFGNVKPESRDEHKSYEALIKLLKEYKKNQGTLDESHWREKDRKEDEDWHSHDKESWDQSWNKSSDQSEQSGKSTTQDKSGQPLNKSSDQSGQSSQSDRSGQSDQVVQSWNKASNQSDQSGQSGQLDQSDQSWNKSSGQPGQKSGQSEQSDQSGQSVQSDKLGQSGQSDKLGQSGQSDKSGQSGQSDQSGQPDQSGQSWNKSSDQPGQKSGQSSQSSQSDQSGQLGQSSQSDQSGQSGQSSQSDQSWNKSDQSNQSSQSWNKSSGQSSQSGQPSKFDQSGQSGKSWNKSSDQSDQSDQVGQSGDKSSVQSSSNDNVQEDNGHMGRLLSYARSCFEDFVNPNLGIEKQIPMKLLSDAYGIVFLTEIKAGFVVGASLGRGIILSRKKDKNGWTGPCAISLGGVSVGWLAGAEKTEHIIVLRDEKVLETFLSNGQLKFGGDISFAVGPLGRDANISINVNDRGYAPIYSYSMSKGVYMGTSLEGHLITIRDDTNEEYYGKKVKATDILYGHVEAQNDKEYQLLCERLDKYICRNQDDSGNKSSFKQSQDDSEKKSSVQSSQDDSGNKSSFQSSQDDSGNKLSFQSSQDDSGNKSSFQSSQDGSGNKSSFQPSQDDSGNKSSFQPSQDDSGNKSSFQPSQDDSGNKSSFQPSQDDSGNKSSFQSSQDSGNKSSFQSFQDDSRNKSSFKSSQDDSGNQSSFKPSQEDLGNQSSLKASDNTQAKTQYQSDLGNNSSFKSSNEGYRDQVDVNKGKDTDTISSRNMNDQNIKQNI